MHCLITYNYICNGTIIGQSSVAISQTPASWVNDHNERLASANKILNKTRREYYTLQFAIPMSDQDYGDWKGIKE